MPQITFEHSSNLENIDYKTFFLELYSVVSKLPNIGTCKIRAISQDNYYIGAENGENAFAYLKVLMKPGQDRTALLRENLAHDLMPIIKKHISPDEKINKIKCYPTVEVGLLSEQYYWIQG